MINAKDAAQALECSLMILRKDKDGWVFGFRVHPNEVPRSLLDASLGTRFHMVFFEINDDETYVVPEEARKGMIAVSTAGQMCREELFQKWMLNKGGVPYATCKDTEVTAANLLREFLDIESRSDLKENEDARNKFRDLIVEYRHETKDRPQG